MASTTALSSKRQSAAVKNGPKAMLSGGVEDRRSADMIAHRERHTTGMSYENVRIMAWSVHCGRCLLLSARGM